MGIEPDVRCTRCKRKRPFPEDGKMTMTVEGELEFVVDTDKACDWNCTETRVRIRIALF
jgi:hypothetical protein